MYRVTLTLKGNKPEEYIFDISLSEYFTIESDMGTNDSLKDTLVAKKCCRNIDAIFKKRSIIADSIARYGMCSIACVQYQ